MYDDDNAGAVMAWSKLVSLWDSFVSEQLQLQQGPRT